jgi:hypothetical protein
MDRTNYLKVVSPFLYEKYKYSGKQVGQEEEAFGFLFQKNINGKK